jgi:hypothetical protein
MYLDNTKCSICLWLKRVNPPIQMYTVNGESSTAAKVPVLFSDGFGDDDRIKRNECSAACPLLLEILES